MQNLRQKVYSVLRNSESFFKTDMVYLTKGGSWLSLGQFISSLSSFLLIIAFANLVPKETYGTYKYILSIVGILLIPSLPGMNTAVSMAAARNLDGTLIHSLRAKIQWGLLGSLASLILAGYYFVNENATLAISFLISAAFLPFIDAFAIFGPFLNGKKEFKISTKYNSIIHVVSSVFMAGTIFLTTNLILILLSYLISWTVLRYVLFNITVKKFVATQDFDPQAIPYGKHLSLMKIVNVAASYIDRLLVFHFLGAAPLAVYSFAIAMPEQIKGALSSLDTLAFPKFVERDTQEIKAAFGKKAIRLFLLSVVVIGTYILFAPFIYKIFFPQYTEAVFYSQLFAVSMLNLALFPSTTALRAKKNIKGLYVSNFVAPTFQIVIMLVFIIWGGLLGLIIARIISRFFGSILDTYLFYKSPNNTEESLAPASPK